MKSIHLIQNNPDLPPKPVAPGSKNYESGYWALPIEQAKSFIGGNIYFHETQSSPSFFGGIIKGCQLQQDGKWKGRVVFELESLASHKGIRPNNPEGWNRVMNFGED